jgi:heterodisulfide reductase subunit A
LAQIFEVEVDQDGFYQEAEYKWRPVDFLKEGIFTCGAEATAQRALRILTSDRLTAGAIVAEVRHSLCCLCEKCISACPYGARWRDELEEKVMVNEMSLKKK